jgi:hypothetical protein
MRDQEDSNQPTDNEKSNPSSESPESASPATPTQHEVTREPNQIANNQNATARELAREFRWVEVTQLIINGALAIIGIVALWIYHGQLEVMREQLGEIIRQYPEMQKSANAAESAANTASTTLRSSQQQFRNEQRPYIFASPRPAGNLVTMSGIQHPVVEPLSNGRVQIDITVEITNGGKSPAINTFSTESRMYLGPRKELQKKFKSFVPEYATGNGDIVASNVTQVVPTGNFLSLSPEEVKLVNKNELAVYILGAVKYTDVFAPHLEAPYETKYCFVYNPVGLPLGGCGATIK